MTKDEALDKALEALTVLLDEWTQARQAQLKGIDAITAIKQSRSAQVQEPVAWLKRHELADLQTCNYRRLGADSPRIWAPNAPDAPPPELDLVAVYTTPPAAQRQWVGLTDEQIDKLFGDGPYVPAMLLRNVARAIEAKLKEKNGS
jgi:hypothetical protein